MACAGCLLDGHGDTLAAIASVQPCCGPSLAGIGDATDECAGPFVGPLAFVWPSDVRDKIKEIDAAFQGTDVSVKACAGLDATRRAGWSTDLATWSAFVADGVGTFGAANKLEAALRWQCRLRQWQDLITATSCTLAGPEVPKPTPSTSVETAVGTLKTVAVAGAVIAGVVLVAPLVWEWVGSKALAKGRRSR